MHKILLILAIAGLLVSGYLFVTYVSPIPIICGENGGCHEVKASPYAYPFGIPMPAFGLAFYVTLALIASLWNESTSKRLYFPLVFLTGTGFVCSLWLTYIEAFVIDAWCTWCVASAVLATLAFMVSWVRPAPTPNI